MSRWWQSEGPPEPAQATRAAQRPEQLPAVDSPPIAEKDPRRDAIERTRKLIEAMPDRR
jgi:hypothetical protein